MGFGVDDEIGPVGLFESGVFSGELLYLACLHFRVKPFGIAFGAGFEGGFYVDFEEVFVADDIAGELSELVVRGNERGYYDGPGFSEELGDFGNAPDVFESVLVGESEILIESAADVVAVENFDEAAVGVELTLKQVGEGALTGPAETIHPNDAAALPQQFLLCFTGKHFVEDGVDVVQMGAHGRKAEQCQALNNKVEVFVQSALAFESEKAALFSGHAVGEFP